MRLMIYGEEIPSDDVFFNLKREEDGGAISLVACDNHGEEIAVVVKITNEGVLRRMKMGSERADKIGLRLTDRGFPVIIE